LQSLLKTNSLAGFSLKTYFMSLILCLETATQVCSVVLAKNDEIIAIRESKEHNSHSALITIFIEEVMKEGEHFGVIPGTQGKPSLLKAGAEKLGFMFRLAPDFEISEKEFPKGHIEYRVTCKITNIESGKFLGEGVGSASTMESKYKYRKASRVCPSCGKETIIKGKEEFGGGWLCFTRKGGCGEKFRDGDLAIEGQESGRIENADIADCYNTVLKMAKKRAHVDAMLTVTAASDIFTQDIEDYSGIEPKHGTVEYIPPAEKQKVPEQKSTPSQKPAPQKYEKDFPYMLEDGEEVPEWFKSLPGTEKVKWAPKGFSISGGRIHAKAS